MQVGTKVFYQSQITSMTDLQTKLGRIQEEISSGKKLLAPSDDPGAYTVATRLNQSVSALEQYGRNIGMAKSRLSQEDSVLQSTSTIVTRLNELAIQGANGTNSNVSRDAIAKEMDQLSEQLMALGNSVDANGDYLFAGYKSNKPPFEKTPDGIIYKGDTGRKEVELAQGVSTPTSSNGQELFMNVSRNATTNQSVSIFETIKNTVAALKNGPLDNDHLKGVHDAIDHFSTYQAICGSRMQKVETADSNRVGQLTNTKTTLSTIQDADLASLASELQQKSLTLQAAQSVFAKISQISLFNYLK